MSGDSQKLSKEQRSQRLRSLVETTEAQKIMQDLKSGVLSVKQLHQTIGFQFNEHPLIQSLGSNDQRALLGMLTGMLRSALPKAPKKLGPGEEILKKNPQERDAWRREQVQRFVSPISYLYSQVRHGLSLERGNPRRRDLAWDIVNTAITAMRYVTVVALSDYVEQGLSDPQLNRVLVDALRKPSDGIWTMLMFSPDAGKKHSLVHVLSQRKIHLKPVQELETKIGGSNINIKGVFGTITGLPTKAPKTLGGLVDSFVQFRNQLVHGAYSRRRPSDEIVEALGLLLDITLSYLRPVLRLPVLVATKDSVLSANGPTLAAIEDASHAQFLKDNRNQPILMGKNRPISLAPWLTVADLNSAIHQSSESSPETVLQIAEICFCNRFESEILHYLGFAARTQLAHIELIETEEAEKAYQLFSTTLEQLRQRSAPASARKANPIQRFDAMARFHGENFVGRGDVMAEIESFILRNDACLGVMRAAPGMGKSAIFSYFYRKYGAKESADGWIFHFSARADQRDNAILGLRSLIAQAEQQIRRNHSKPPKFLPLPWSYEDLCGRFEKVLLDLGACMKKVGKKAVVVIDALDEQAPRPGAPPESIFKGLPQKIPDNVVVLVSVRIDANGDAIAIDEGSLSAPRGFPIAKTNPLLGLTEEDVQRLIQEKLAAEKPELTTASPELLARIARAALRPEDGTLDPFYLRFLADGVREGSVDLSDPRNVPEGLETFFDQIWWELDTSHDYLLHRILGMLSEMEGFGSDVLFADALKKPAEEVAKLRFGINKLLILSGSDTGESRYGLFHDRFRWYVQGKFTAENKAHLLHRPLLVSCRNGISAADNYAAHYFSYHLQHLSHHAGLCHAEQRAYQDELWALLHDDQFFQTKFDLLDDENSIRIDFNRGFSVFRPAPEDDDVETARKASLVTQLAYRCVFSVAHVSNLALSRLHHYAKQGEVVRVIQLAQRAKEDALCWMALLRAAQTMQEEELDPTPLYDAIQSTLNPTLRWTDGVMLTRLLQELQSPAEIRDWITARIPVPEV
ncbi:MAG: NACHT domain-containing protein [Myxococcota bacterium]|nr:NACHT domain-containing protein [Myxococcota bacterium]